MIAPRKAFPSQMLCRTIVVPDMWLSAPRSVQICGLFQGAYYSVLRHLERAQLEKSRELAYRGPSGVVAASRLKFPESLTPFLPH